MDPTMDLYGAKSPKPESQIAPEEVTVRQGVPCSAVCEIEIEG